MPYSKMGITETKLVLITKRSKEKPKERFTSLAHLLNSDYLYNCWKELKNAKAPGIDRKTKESYSPELIKSEIEKLVNNLKAKKYRPKPVRRVYIESPKGKQRPLGIPVTMDKIVQLGMKKIIEAIFEPEFIELSYGFRPDKSCHQALKTLYRVVMTKPINWVVDVDIKSFFESVDHYWLMRGIQQKIKDPVFNRLIIRFLKAGIIEQGKYKQTEKGTPQGGIISPVLANIYLHYILDLWFERIEKPRLRGYTEMIRYADDFLIGTQTKLEAEQILKDLRERLEKFGLKFSEEKTKIVEFGRYARQNAQKRGKRKPETFEFLGFRHYCGKSRKENFLMKMKTSSKRKKADIKKINLWLKKVRNRLKIKEIWELLKAKLRGHYNYYGISGNFRSINSVYYQTQRLTFKWLNRRSQKKSFNWKDFERYLRIYPLPKPILTHNFYNLW